MTVLKKTCALFLAFALMLSFVPSTLFHAAETTTASGPREVAAELQENDEASADAAQIARQLLSRSSSKDDRIQLESEPEYADDAQVEIIVVVDDTTASADSSVQTHKLLNEQDAAVAQIESTVLQGQPLQVTNRYAIPFCSTAFLPPLHTASTSRSSRWTASPPFSFPQRLSWCPLRPAATK